MQIKGWNEPKALLDEAISNGSLKSVIGIIGSSDGIIFSHASGTRDIEYKKRIEKAIPKDENFIPGNLTSSPNFLVVSIV